MLEALKAAKVEARMEREEEHSAWKVTIRIRPTRTRTIDMDLALQPEYRRLRTIGRQVAKFNQPPFTVIQAKTEAGDRSRAGASCWSTSRAKACAKSPSSATKVWAR